MATTNDITIAVSNDLARFVLDKVECIYRQVEVFDRGTEAWNDRRLQLTLAEVMGPLQQMCVWARWKQSNNHSKVSPFQKEQAMAQLCRIESVISELRFRLNQKCDTYARAGLQHTADLRARLKCVKAATNEVSINPLNWGDAVDKFYRNRANRRKRKLIKMKQEMSSEEDQLDGERRMSDVFDEETTREELFGELQMECLESIASSVLGPILHEGSAFIGGLVKDTLGLEDNRDSPSQINVNTDDWCLCDVPRPIQSLAFKKVHQAPDAKAVVQQGKSLSMDLAQRFKEKSLVTTFNTSISCSNTSVLLGSVSVSPQVFPVVTGNVVTGPFSREETVMSYFSEFYTFWRGDLDFHIQVINCTFQKGQIGVFFSPNDDILTTADFPGKTSNLLGHTFTIGDENDQVLRVPYVCDTDYRDIIGFYGASTAATGDVNRTWNAVPLSGSLGKIWIYVVNPIVGPATAPQNLYVNVWISSENLTFHVPRQPSFRVTLNGILQSGTEDIEQAMEEMVIEAEEEDEPPAQNVDETTDENPIDEVAQVETADSENIAGRTYVLQANIQWSTGLVRGTSIYTADIPGLLLGNQNLAPAGLYNYHEFFRGGMVVNLQVASQCQYLGQAILVVRPAHMDRPLSECVASLPQLPHAFVDLGQNTKVSVTVPWLHVRRLLRTADVQHRIAVAELVVINPMLVPTGACATINLLMSMSLTAPYFGVKKAPTMVAGVLQAKAVTTLSKSKETPKKKEAAKPAAKATKKPEAKKVDKKPEAKKESGQNDPKQGEKPGVSKPAPKGTSATATKTAKVVKPWKPRNPPTKSYIAPHTSVYDLLKRPQYTGGVVPPTLTAGFQSLAFINPTLHPYIMKITTTFAFWNGGQRVHITSNTSMATDVVMAFQPSYDGEQHQSVLEPFTLGAFPLSTTVGMQVWKPCMVPSTVMALPYYAKTPLLFTPQQAYPGIDAENYGVGTFVVFGAARGGITNFQLPFSCSVGDDFELHFPLPMPKTTFNAPSGFAMFPVGERIGHGVSRSFVRDLTQDGDVESNPGPLAMWVRRQLTALIDDVISDQTEKARVKIQQTKVFLLKHCASNIVDDVIVPVLSAIMDIALHIRLIYVETSKTVIMAAFTAIALRVYGAASDAMATVEYIRKCFQAAFNKEVKSEDMGPIWNVDAMHGCPYQLSGDLQSGPGLAGGVAMAALAAVVGTFGMVVSQTAMSNAKQDADNRFFRTCGALGRVGAGAQGIRHIWNAVKDGLTVAFEYFMEPEPATKWWKENKEKVEVFMTCFQAAKQQNCFAAGEDPRPYVGDLFDDHNESLVMGMILHFPKLPLSDVGTTYRLLLKEVISTKAKMAAQTTASAQRCEPVGVWIAGGPGCGKSVFGKEILPSLLCKQMGWGNWVEELYQMPRDANQKHYDGYRKQKIVAMDDYCQATDDLDALEAINLISSANLPLSMANLEDKLITFTSKVVMVSTNLQSAAGNVAIKKVEALTRRFPVSVWLDCRKPGVIDYAALVADMKVALAAAPKTTEGKLQAASEVYAKYIRIRHVDIETGFHGRDYTLRELIENIQKEIKLREHPNPLGTLLGDLQMMRSCFDDAKPHPAVVGNATRFPDLSEANLNMEIVEDKTWCGVSSLGKFFIGFGAGVTVYLLWTLFRTFVIEKLCVDGDVQAKYSEVKINTKPTKLVAGKLNADDQMEKIKHNTLRVSVNGNRTYGLAVDNKNIIIPRHLINFGGDLKIQTRKRDGTDGHAIEVGLADSWVPIGYLGNTKETQIDAAMVRLVGGNIDHVRNIRHLFMTTEVWNKMPAFFSGTFDDGTRMNVDKDFYIINDPAHKNMVIHSMTLRTQGTMISGDCGRAYYAEMAVPNRLLGIHNCNVKEKGCPVNRYGFAPLTREDVAAAIAKLDSFFMKSVPIADYQMEGWKCSGVEPTAFDEGKLELLGKGSVNGCSIARPIVPTTNLVKTKMQHPAWDDNFMPSVKRVVEVDGKEIHPLLTNAQKYCFHPGNVSAKIYGLALNEFNRYVPCKQGRQLTNEECLNGVGEMNRVVTSTSSGVIAPFVSKEELIDHIPGEVVDGVHKPDTLVFSEKAKTLVIPWYGRTFTDQYQYCEEQLKAGQKPDFVWVSTLKDELRPKEKAKKGKTRVFENPDFIYNLLQRKYFGAFTNWYKANRGFRLHHAIGIDREIAAQEIFDGLTWKDRTFDVDYGNWDGSVPAILFDFFLGVTDFFYGLEGQTERHVLIDCLRSSLHIIDDRLFLSYQGNKSGNAMTDVFNSVCNAGFIYMTYTHYFGACDSIRENLRFITYGDDVIASVSPNVEGFDRVSVAAVGTALGLTVTSAKKDGVMEPFTPIEEVSFLKSVFRPGNPFRFPLPLEIIHRELRWERKQNKGDDVVLKQRILQALDMACHHTQEVYDTLVSQLGECGYGSWVDGSYEWRQDRLRLKQLESSLADRVENYVDSLGLPILEGEFQSGEVEEDAVPDDGPGHDWRLTRHHSVEGFVHFPEEEEWPTRGGDPWSVAAISYPMRWTRYTCAAGVLEYTAPEGFDLFIGNSNYFVNMVGQAGVMKFRWYTDGDVCHTERCTVRYCFRQGPRPYVVVLFHKYFFDYTQRQFDYVRRVLPSWRRFGTTNQLYYETQLRCHDLAAKIWRHQTDKDRCRKLKFEYAAFLWGAGILGAVYDDTAMLIVPSFGARHGDVVCECSGETLDASGEGYIDAVPVMQAYRGTNPFLEGGESCWGRHCT